MKHTHIAITPESRARFTNNAAFCVGTGRMGLALQKEYLDQLAMAQELAHFKHIRGHGLFCDDMAIYQPYTDANGVEHEHYGFTYLDRVVDSYLALGIKPFLELGFMPKKMASGKQTIFYWQGNTTPPADSDKWARMVKATLRHLADRYGEEEVSTWLCEVWNEPNLPGFWENADREKYLQLYKVTSKAVKEALPNMRVGGPAICGGEMSLGWMEAFLDFCRDERLPLDFITRHAYMAQTPHFNGKYMYHEMCAVEFTLDEMQRTRDLIDSYPEFKGMEMHITEFNTSYNPLCPIHDTNLNAAYIAGLLGCLGDVAASYSYWTFGDVFEECGVPTRPFHGGFGMIANGLIAKPTMWTFAFFNGLKGDCVYRDENLILMRKVDGSYEGVAWNLCREGREALTISLRLVEDGKHTVLSRMVDEECTNPLKMWHEMGEPASLNDAQLRILREAGQPLSRSELADGVITLTLKPNAVAHVSISRYEPTPEYGYEYEWYEQHV